MASVQMGAGRKWAMKIFAVAGIVLAGLLAGGCAHEPTSEQLAMQSCTRFAISAIRHGITVVGVPAACRGLTRAQINAAAGAALAATFGHPRKIVIAREHQQQLRPLLLHPVGTFPPIPRLPPASALGAPAAGGPPFALVALVTWLITVGLGLTMLARWIARGGLRRRGTGRARFLPALNFAHLGLAVAGLTAWIVYMVTGLTGVAWAACGLLLPVAGLGMVLVSRWFPERSAANVAVPAAQAVPVAAGAASAPAGFDPPPARHPPALIVATHVAFATATILFTVLAAIGSG
jgi:hypothetical protein